MVLKSVCLMEVVPIGNRDHLHMVEWNNNNHGMMLQEFPVVDSADDGFELTVWS